MERTELIAKYEQALQKAENTEKLRCHVLAIQKKLEELKDDNYKVTVLDQLWVDYFNGD